jgi:phosphoribosylformylglycinamidine (FGAM) synthase-like enzyme
VGVWKAPVPLDPPDWVLKELQKPRDYTADLKKLLASANICDKRWVFEQYDSMVQTNTVQGPGGEAGVMRVKQGTGNREQGTEEQGTGDREQGTGKVQRGIAMALAGNGRWAWLDPKLGAMHAVAEAARKVACTGATPVAATNCLNFGNPEKPEIMAQLSAAIDGIAEACTALGTPVTGGNVSLYNETKGEGIYPTPVIGIVGLLEDVSKAVPSGFQKTGDRVLLLQSTVDTPAALDQELGSSDFAQANCGALWGTPPWINLKAEAAMNKALISLAERGLIHSAKDISDGGLATALAQASFANNVGVRVTLGALSESDYVTALFAENAAEVLVTCSFEDYGMICTFLDEAGEIWPLDLGETIADRVQINAGGISLLDTTIAELKQPWSNTLESQLAAEVVTA